MTNGMFGISYVTLSGLLLERSVYYTGRCPVLLNNALSGREFEIQREVTNQNNIHLTTHINT